MKKLCLLAMLMISTSSLAQFNQRNVAFNVGAYGGFNCNESTPVAGVTASVDAWWFRVEVDGGWTYFWTEDLVQKQHFYVSPSFGVVFGYYVRIYGLIGAANWLGIDRKLNTIRDNLFCMRFKLGCEVPLNQWLSIGANWSCILNPDQDRFEVEQANTLSVGLAVRF